MTVRKLVFLLLYGAPALYATALPQAVVARLQQVVTLTLQVANSLGLPGATLRA